MNKIQKTILSMLVIAMFAFSAGAALVQASGLPWTTNTLVTPGQLTVAGSSTVGPIATEEINPTAGGNFVAYWNNLVSTGVVTSSDISQVNLATLGSGTAVPALAGTAGTADVGISKISAWRSPPPRRRGSARRARAMCRKCSSTRSRRTATSTANSVTPSRDRSSSSRPSSKLLQQPLHQLTGDYQKPIVGYVLNQSCRRCHTDATLSRRSPRTASGSITSTSSKPASCASAATPRWLTARPFRWARARIR